MTAMPMMRMALFALTLLWGQWAALAHLPFHADEGTDTPHATCELCVAQAAYDHAVLSASESLSVEPGSLRPTAAAVAAVFAAALAPYRARAPPRSLA